MYASFFHLFLFQLFKDIFQYLCLNKKSLLIFHILTVQEIE